MSPSRFCPQCGREQKVTGKPFCADCGSSLASIEQSAPPPHPGAIQAATARPRYPWNEQVLLEFAFVVLVPIGTWLLISLAWCLAISSNGLAALPVLGSLAAGLGFHFAVADRTLLVQGVSSWTLSLVWLAAFLAISASSMVASATVARRRPTTLGLALLRSAAEAGAGAAITFGILTLIAPTTVGQLTDAVAALGREYGLAEAATGTNSFQSSTPVSSGPVIGATPILFAALWIGALTGEWLEHRTRWLVGPLADIARAGVAALLGYALALVAFWLVAIPVMLLPVGPLPGGDIGLRTVNILALPNWLAAGIAGGAGATFTSGPQLEGTLPGWAFESPWDLALSAVAIVVVAFLSGRLFRALTRTRRLRFVPFLAVGTAVVVHLAAVLALPSISGEGAASEYFNDRFSLSLFPNLPVLVCSSLAIGAAAVLLPYPLPIARWSGRAVSTFRGGGLRSVGASAVRWARTGPLLGRLTVAVLLAGLIASTAAAAYVNSAEFRVTAAVRQLLQREPSPDLADSASLADALGLAAVPADISMDLDSVSISQIPSAPPGARTWSATGTVIARRAGSEVGRFPLSARFTLEGGDPAFQHSAAGAPVPLEALIPTFTSRQDAQAFVDAANKANSALRGSVALRVERANDNTVPIPEDTILLDPTNLIGTSTRVVDPVSAVRESWFYASSGGRVLIGTQVIPPIPGQTKNGSYDPTGDIAEARQVLAKFLAAKSRGDVKTAARLVSPSSGLAISGLRISTLTPASTRGEPKAVGPVSSLSIAFGNARLRRDSSGNWRVGYGGQPLVKLGAGRWARMNLPMVFTGESQPVKARIRSVVWRAGGNPQVVVEIRNISEYSCLLDSDGAFSIDLVRVNGKVVADSSPRYEIEFCIDDVRTLGIELSSTGPIRSVTVQLRYSSLSGDRIAKLTTR